MRLKQQAQWNIYNFEKYLYFMISARVQINSWLGWIATADDLLTININNIEVAKIYIDPVYDFRIVILSIRSYSVQKFMKIHENSMMYWFWLFT